MKMKVVKPKKKFESVQVQEEKRPNAENPKQQNQNVDNKRAITYEMAKNKGLTPHRKKDQRNPRVKYKNKYKKAVIRRKGAIREVRKELKKYDGEYSGINASVVKGIKLK